MSTDLLWQLAAVLAAARIGAEVAQRLLKQSAIIGEIFAGVVLANLMPKLHLAESRNLQMLAGLGAVFLLFEVGLHSDATQLARRAFPSLWLAVVGAAVALLSMLTVGSLYHLPIAANMMLAVALSATSIGVTGRVLAEGGAQASTEGQIVLCAAVADDVIGMVLLGAVSTLAAGARAGSVTALAWHALIAVLFLVVSLVAGPYLAPGFMRMAATLKSRGAMAVMAVAAALGLGAGAQAAGLAPPIGAFAAGLLLAKSEQKVHFEKSVSAFAELLVPVFFVVIGAQFNLPALFHSGDSAGLAVFLAVSMLATVVVARLVAAYSVPARGLRRPVLAVAMLPRGEVALIAGSMGLAAHLLTVSLYAALVLAVLGSVIVTPPLLKLALGRNMAKGGV